MICAQLRCSICRRVHQSQDFPGGNSKLLNVPEMLQLARFLGQWGERECCGVKVVFVTEELPEDLYATG